MKTVLPASHHGTGLYTNFAKWSIMQPMIRKAQDFVLTNFGQGRWLNDIKRLYGELLGL